MNNKKDIVHSFVDAINNKNWSQVINLVHDDFIRHSSSEPKEINTNSGLIEFHKGELKVFPDIEETIVFSIEEGDMVAARIRFSGTQKGNLGNFPPSGRKLVACYNCFFRVVEGKIKETWVEYDNLNGLIQLGHFKN